MGKPARWAWPKLRVLVNGVLEHMQIRRKVKRYEWRKRMALDRPTSVKIGPLEQTVHRLVRSILIDRQKFRSRLSAAPQSTPERPAGHQQQTIQRSARWTSNAEPIETQGTQAERERHQREFLKDLVNL